MRKLCFTGAYKSDLAMRQTQQTVRLLEQRFLESKGIITKVNRFYQQKTAELLKERGCHD